MEIVLSFWAILLAWNTGIWSKAQGAVADPDMPMARWKRPSVTPLARTRWLTEADPADSPKIVT